MKAKRVLFVIDSLAGGGAEKVLLTVLHYLDREKFDLTLCCLLRKGKFLGDIPFDVRTIFLLPESRNLSSISLLWYKIKYKLIYSWLPPRMVYRLFIPKGNDVEISFLEGSPARILSGSTNRKARRITWVHTDFQNILHTSLYKSVSEEIRIYNSFDTVVTVSDDARKAFRNELPEVKTPVVVCYNPVDNNEIIKKSLDNDDVPDKCQRIRMISVGRLVHQKAFDRLLRIFKRLTEDGFAIELWIVGEGSERRKLQDYIDAQNLAGYVRLWGFKENPYSYIKKSDLFVCSSIAEGFSTAATEALLLGIPVVTTRCAGMNELLSSGGGIITENDESSLYAGLKQVLSDNDLFESLKKEAKARGGEGYIKDKMASIESLLLK